MNMRFMGALVVLLAWGCDAEPDKPKADDTGDVSSTPTDGDGDGDADADADADDTGTPPPCTDFDMNLMDGETLLPSVVRISFKLTCDGAPVIDKTEEDFTILEDDDAISVFESAQQVVPTVASYQLSTLLLLDMSGSIVDSGNLPALQTATHAFIATMGGEQDVAIYTFDGREDPSLLVPFSRDTELLSAGVDSLTDFEVVDASTNLNGAVIAGLDVLDDQAALHTDKLFAGTMAVFTDGKDQAGRVSSESAVLVADASDHAVYAIGLGGEIDEERLIEIGKSGAVFATDADGLSTAFDEVATEIINQASSIYVLAYCSPKRAGNHDLELQLTGTDESITYEFSAAGFDGGCDPTDFVPPEFLDLDEDGYRPYDGDCDDNDASRYPGAEETCNEIDDDCDDEVDEDATDLLTWYADVDGDGFGNAESTTESCDEPDGYTEDDTDCDDDDAFVFPGRSEIPYDGTDNDCDAATLDDDLDEDGFDLADDCDDADDSIHPDAEEICDDIDNDCDDEIDEDAATGATLWYPDDDDDGYGASTGGMYSCDVPDGFVSTDTDCDDTTADAHPSHPEVPYDGIDNDCNPSTVDDDLDGDGYDEAEDCDDDDASVNPDATEICNDIDDDCDDEVDEDDAADTLKWSADVDGDGFGSETLWILSCDAPDGWVIDDTDCDDTDASIFPGTTDICDGIDNDCDDEVDEDFDSGDDSVCLNDLDPGDLIITEVMFNPAVGSDDDNEWIEIYNTTEDRIQLAGLEIGDDDPGVAEVTTAMTIEPGAYAVLARGDAEDTGWSYGFTPDGWYGRGLVMGNTGETMRIQLGAVLFDTIPDYSDADLDSGRSWQLDQDVLNADDNDDAAQWCGATTDLDGDEGTPGARNDDCSGAFEPFVAGDDWVSDTTGYTMTFIEPGTFGMGCTPEMDIEGGCADDEFPAHVVELTQGIYVGTTEITQGQWTAVMGTNPSGHTACGDTCPVEMVSWYDAVLFANTLSELDGLSPAYTIGSTEDGVTWDLGAEGYRLPTEAEWEYVARAGEGTPFAGSDSIDEVAWYVDTAGSTTHPVGELLPNGHGLFDLAGNVSEWVWDWLDGEYYSWSPPVDPLGPSSGINRIHRGGSWAYDARSGRSSHRNANEPEDTYSLLGLRLVRTVDPYPCHGSAEACPATSCRAIRDAGTSTGDGTYWIDPAGTGAFEAYCDMTSDGGGWTLIAIVHPAKSTGLPEPAGWFSTERNTEPLSSFTLHTDPADGLSSFGTDPFLDYVTDESRLSRFTIHADDDPDFTYSWFKDVVPDSFTEWFDHDTTDTLVCHDLEMTEDCAWGIINGHGGGGGFADVTFLGVMTLPESMGGTTPIHMRLDGDVAPEYSAICSSTMSHPGWPDSYENQWGNGLSIWLQ